MSRIAGWQQRLQAQSGLYVVLGLLGASVVLLMAAFFGAIKASHPGTTEIAASNPALQQPLQNGAATDSTGAAATEGSLAANDSALALGGGTSGAAAAVRTRGAAGPGTPGGPAGTVATAPTVADRTGVTATQVKWGVHGPQTLNGAPLPIAKDPLDGITLYLDAINTSGGVNGRKIIEDFADDRYTVDGGTAAANTLIDNDHNFMVSGTLGIDQIYQVAKKAHERNTPYMAGGGPEANIFRDLGVYQAYSSYDTFLVKLASLLGKESKTQGSPYFGLTKVGVSQLDSPYITPGVTAFGQALANNGLQLVKVVKVQKPDQQTSYSTQLQDLKSAGTEIFVPAQDPVTTSREVAECKSQLCTWKYSFSDFAHDADTDLTLVSPSDEWDGMKGLSPGCYYQAPNADNPAKCAAMGKAHALWVKAKGEDDWTSHGSGGAFGYQVVHFWLKALIDAGPDPTRQKLWAALNTYNGYNDLITGPITMLNSPNHMHGNTQMVVLLACGTKHTAAPCDRKTGEHYAQLIDGLTDNI